MCPQNNSRTLGKNNCDTSRNCWYKSCWRAITSGSDLAVVSYPSPNNDAVARNNTSYDTWSKTSNRKAGNRLTVNAHYIDMSQVSTYQFVM
jgi:hypothetical protein